MGLVGLGRGGTAREREGGSEVRMCLRETVFFHYCHISFPSQHDAEQYVFFFFFYWGGGGEERSNGDR